MRTQTLLVLVGVISLVACEGAAGKDGADGTVGADGAAGEPGTVGADGQDGADASGLDADGDGINVGDDCNDDDASIGEASTYYIDYDGDGYGYTGVTNMLCEPMTGWVDNAEDCDDLDAEISPDATEVCDLLDNDCDGDIDDEDGDVDPSNGITIYADSDSDGYGDDDDVGALSCAVASGYSEIQGDCDDDDVDVNPAAVEICENGVDDNCDGGAPECFLAPSLEQGVDDDFTVSNPSSTSYDYFGAYRIGSGDFNGDGYDDLAICAYGNDDYSTNAGTAYLYMGSSSLGASLAAEGGSITGPSSFGYFGSNIDGAGDVDGDGYDDLVVGAYGDDQAFLVYGSATGLATDTNINAVIANGSAAVLYSTSSTYYLGYEVQGIGDTDADGFDDFLVMDYASSSSSYTGTAYLVMGSASAMVGAVDVATESRAALSQGSYGSYFGSREATAGGDFNADGYDDIVVGEYGNDTDGTNYGRAYMWTGPVSGASAASSANVTFTASSATGDSSLGRSVETVGDWNGDGYDDLAIGAYWYDVGSLTDAGATFVYFGATSWTSTVDVASADVTIEGSNSFDYAAAAHAIGDFDQDGTDDLAVGMEGYDTGSNSSVGAVSIFLGATGSAGGTFSAVTDANAFIEGTSGTSNSYVGRVVTGADMDNDGYRELYIADYLQSSYTGEVAVFETSGM
jgi:hypothetical protein